ncbi:MAG: formyltransferase family protein [bacterium]|nr:formyltransferase family protein [bacterium]
MKKLLVFASGGKESDDGGSGFQELVENSRSGVLEAEIVAVVSNHEHGGVRTRADKLGVPFIYFPLPREAEDYQRIVAETKADFVSLSGWLKMVKGLDPTRTINIHPGDAKRFGGAGMYGHFVHKAVMEAYRAGTVKCSAVTMHFVTEKYDDGPDIFRYPVAIRPDDTSETLAKRANKIEHAWQSYITNLVVKGEISWDGVNPGSLKIPVEVPILEVR